MSVFSREGSRLVFRYDREQLWIEPWGENSLRVRATKLHEMPEAEWALLPRTDGPTPVGIRILEQSATVENGDISAEITAAGKLSLYRKDGRLLLEEFVRNRKSFSIGTGEKTLQGFASALDIDAREFKPILSGDYALTLRFESDPAERLYGMGQYQQPYLNLKGCMLELAQRNSQASVPFVVSSLGYGFLWNNPGIGRVTFGRNVTTWEASSTKVMDYWVTAGENPAAILSSYARATGSVPMMPDWAMGFWQCKLRYQTQEELLQVAREYKRRGLPISVIVIDFFHWPMQGEWKFDPEYWPDPDAMIAELNGLGIELMVSVWPTVDHRSENYPEMVEKGYLISTDRGHRIAMDFHGNTVHFDATNPGARAYVWQKCKANYYDKGIRLFWLDEAEPEYTSYDFDLYRYHLGPDVQVGNIYPALYARAFYEGMEAAGQEKIINLIRCAWAGSQRYGALVWSGDIHSSFESMRNQFAAGLNMGMAGIPWWTTDIGGFHGGNINDPAFGELLVRWFQYGAFCPVMRLHGVREPQTPPLGNSGGGVCNSGAANEVWSYGPEVYEILKGYLFMRERLRPYISGLMKEAHQNGSPVIRPLFYEFPEDEDAWRCEDAFMFGPDLLVAPVMYAGARSREVYLPAESRWTNAWTNEVLSGGQTVTVAAPLSQIPLFLRNDVKLPIQEGG